MLQYVTTLLLFSIFLLVSTMPHILSRSCAFASFIFLYLFHSLAYTLPFAVLAPKRRNASIRFPVSVCISQVKTREQLQSEVAYSSEELATIQRTRRCKVPKDSIFPLVLLLSSLSRLFPRFSVYVENLQHTIRTQFISAP
jgi:hypothetical protein